MSRFKYKFAGRVPKQQKVDAISAVYERGDRALDIANKLSSLTKTKVSSSSVIGFYGRNRKLLKDYPLLDRARRVPPAAEESEQMKLRLRRKPEPATHAPLPVRTPETIQPPKIEAVTSLKIPLMALGPRQCRWGTHETVKDGHLFCGHQTLLGKSYCEHHTKISQQKTYKEMRAEAERVNAPKMMMLEGPVKHA